MNIISFLDLRKTDTGDYVLPYHDHCLNMVGSIHASVQFAFAEITTGYYLRNRFPEYESNTIALLRKSQVKYRTQALTELHSKLWIEPSVAEQFLNRLRTRGKATIEVTIDLIDVNGATTLTGQFEWFISILNG